MHLNEYQKKAQRFINPALRDIQEERMDDEGEEYYCFYINGILVAQNYWIESMKEIGERITENSDEDIRIGFHVNTENNGICTEIRKLLTNFLRKQKLL